ncbi:MAG TPA: carbohydrate ABC transporter permease [bacterium]|nr:carbohydrate ABC transporter permease [bacterium]
MLLIALLVATLYPVLWMVGASFEPSAQIFVNVGLLPKVWTFANYQRGWYPMQNLSFSRLFANSLIIACVAVLGNVCSCTMAAYAFARLQFRLRGTLFAIMLLTIMLPYQVLIIPQYILFLRFGWLNTYLPLVVPRLLAVDGFFVFLMVQFIRGLPREIDEAAIIDGCGHWQVFLRIVVPLSMPAMATTGIFTFINSWNDFLGPLLYLTKPVMYTVPLGLNLFLDLNEASQWGPLFAMSALSLVPIFVIFLFFERLLTEGIATTGIK